MAYCIYLRKSRADKEAELAGKGETLKRHKDTLLELARSRNLVVEEIYQEVVSGDSIEARPQMKRLLNDVAQGKWDGVIVMEIERLARGDTTDQGIVTKTFVYSDTKIITPLKTYDPTDEFDQEYFEFGLYMSRREYKTIKRRLYAGMIASCKEGNYIHNKPPFGYEIVKNEKVKGYRLEPKPGEAEIVRLIFQWFAFGEQDENGRLEKLGVGQIAEKLNKEYIIKPAGGKWTGSTISTMLKNEHYLGYIVFGKSKRQKVIKDGRVVEKWKYNDAGEYQLFKGKHPALVDENTFRLAGKRFKTVTKRPNCTLANPLAGIVKCGVCGANMYRRPYGKNGEKPILMCRKKGCNNVSVSYELVEKALLETVKQWMGEYEVKASAENNMGIVETKKSLIKEMEKQIDQYRHQLAKVYQAFENEIYNEEIFAERRKILEEKITEAGKSCEKLKEEIDGDNILEEPMVIGRKNNSEEVINRSRKNFEQRVEDNSLSEEIVEKTEKDSVGRNSIWDIIENADVQQKNNILKLILKKVIYTKKANGHYKNQSPDDFTLEIYPKLPKK